MNYYRFNSLTLLCLVLLTFGCKPVESPVITATETTTKTSEQRIMDALDALKMKNTELINQIYSLSKAIEALEKVQSGRIDTIKTSVLDLREQFIAQNKRLETYKNDNHLSDDLYNETKDALNKFQTVLEDKIESINKVVDSVNSSGSITEEQKEELRQTLVNNDEIKEAYENYQEKKKELEKDCPEKFEDDSFTDAIMAIFKLAIIGVCAYVCPEALPAVMAGLGTLDAVVAGNRKNGSGSQEYGDGSGGSGNRRGGSKGPSRKGTLSEGDFDGSVSFDENNHITGIKIHKKTGNDVAFVQEINFTDPANILQKTRKEARTYEVKCYGDNIVQIIYENDIDWLTSRTFTFIKNESGEWDVQP